MFVDGPYRGRVSDTTIFDIAVRENRQGLRTWLQSLSGTGAILGLDGGFPSAHTTLNKNGCANLLCTYPERPRAGEVNVALTPEQALRNRLLTRWRGVVERLNQRLKIYRLLSVRYRNSELASAKCFWQVAGIIANRWYGTPLARMDPLQPSEQHSSRYLASSSFASGT